MNRVILEYLTRQRLLEVARQLEGLAAELQQLADEIRSIA